MHLLVYLDICTTCIKVILCVQRYVTVVIHFTQIMWVLLLQHVSGETVGQAKGPIGKSRPSPVDVR